MNKRIIRRVAFCGIFVAVAIALENLTSLVGDFLPFWPSGGSISITLVPLFYISYKEGFYGFICGVIVGLAQKLYIVSFPQVALDYMIPFGIIGLSGYLCNLYRQAKHRNLIKEEILVFCGITICMIIRLLSHTLSGTLFWETPFLGSLIYNSEYVVPTYFISLLIVLLTYSRLSKIIDSLNNDSQLETPVEEQI